MADEVVGAFEKRGCVLARSRYPLLIGSYFSNIDGESLHGSIRNVSLGIPQNVANRAMFYKAASVKSAPVIDGTLDDPLLAT